MEKKVENLIIQKRSTRPVRSLLFALVILGILILTITGCTQPQTPSNPTPPSNPPPSNPPPNYYGNVSLNQSTNSTLLMQ